MRFVACLSLRINGVCSTPWGAKRGIDVVGKVVIVSGLASILKLRAPQYPPPRTICVKPPGCPIAALPPEQRLTIAVKASPSESRAVERRSDPGHVLDNEFDGGRIIAP